MKINCAACGASCDFPETGGFRTICPACDSWLHTCTNCRFLVGGSCTEPAAEKVRDPEGQNFCEWFEGRDKGQGTGDKEPGRDAAEEMWKKLTKK